LSDGTRIQKDTELKFNESHKFELQLNIPSTASYSTPYWLETKGTLGMYQVDDQSLIGLPETPKEMTATFNVSIEGETLSYVKTIIYKTNDPVKGEVYKPFEIVPIVSAHIAEPVI